MILYKDEFYERDFSLYVNITYKSISSLSNPSALPL